MRPARAVAALLAGVAGLLAGVAVLTGGPSAAQAKLDGVRRMTESGRPPAWQVLDVAMLQTLVLEETLGLDAEAITSGNFVSYTRDAQAAAQAVQSGSAQLATLMRPTPVQQLRDVALTGERMPQKSTYFYPKLITGLVINPLW